MAAAHRPGCHLADSVQLACDGQIVRMCPIRHDRAKEHGAFATRTSASATETMRPVEPPASRPSVRKV